MIRHFFQSRTAEPECCHRRRLRYMRLERRLMLSGDFGELFETDDEFDLDDLEESHHEESASAYDDDSHEYASDDDYDHGSDGGEDESRLVTFQLDDTFAEFGSDAAESSDDPDIGVDSELSTADSNAPIQSNLTDELQNGTFESSTDDATVPLIDGAAPLLDRVEHHDVVSPPITSTQHHSTMDGLSPQTMQEDRSAQAKPTPPNEADAFKQHADPTDGIQQDLNFQSKLGILHSANARTSAQHATNHFPTTTSPAANEELNADSIAWLGSFADDISAFDEALDQFVADTRRVAETSIESLAHPGPLVTAGVITTGLASRMIYRRKKAKDSELENDHYAVGFDVRLYPEVFG